MGLRLPSRHHGRMISKLTTLRWQGLDSGRLQWNSRGRRCKERIYGGAVSRTRCAKCSGLNVFTSTVADLRRYIQYTRVPCAHELLVRFLYNSPVAHNRPSDGLEFL